MARNGTWWFSPLLCCFCLGAALLPHPVACQSRAHTLWRCQCTFFAWSWHLYGRCQTGSTAGDYEQVRGAGLKWFRKDNVAWQGCPETKNSGRGTGGKTCKDCRLDVESIYNHNPQIARTVCRVSLHASLSQNDQQCTVPPQKGWTIIYHDKPWDYMSFRGCPFLDKHHVIFCMSQVQSAPEVASKAQSDDPPDLFDSFMND